MSENKHKIDATDENFLEVTVEASKEVPIVLDFWGANCAPCLRLAPILEAFAEEYGGKFRLVKANVQDTPQSAGQFNVMSIPAVFALVDGEIVDGFQGLMPEEDVKSWLDRVVEQGTILTVRALEKTDPGAALEQYQQMLSASPNDSKATVGVARMLKEQGKQEELAAFIKDKEGRGFLEPELTQIKAQIHIAEEGEGISLDEARAAADQNPNDLESKFKLAEGLAATGEHEEALTHCLAIISAQPDGVGDEARKLMLDIFRVLPDDSPLTTKYRRKLSSLLF
jgi:putative thioredoxin